MASTDKGAPSPMARLATLRAPRDLSLGGRGLTRGGAIKRKFVPIIPSASKTEVIAPVENNNHNSFSPPTKRHRRSEDQRSDRGQYNNNRGRGRGRSSANLIQTKSTLEAVLQEWTINSKKEKIITPGFPTGPRRAKEEQVIGSVVSQRESEEGLDYLEESTLRDEFFMLSIPKNEEPIPTMNPLALPPKQKYQAKVQKTQTQSHLSENKSGLHPETIYFVTLPNKLPGFPPQQQQQQQKEAAAQNRRTNTIPGAPTTSEENAEEVGSLSNFSEGYIGKLRFRKSGKVELVLGDNVLTGKAGTAQCYQEAAMLDTRLNPPELINFGQVKHCLDFSPDLMSLILKEYKNITINNQGGEGSK